MDTPDLNPQIATLSDSITELEAALAPLINTPLNQTSTKLPLLDKAKLYVLTTYSIESILFSYLRLNGVDAKTHPVFTELTRVKQYFQKIKDAEMGPEKPNMSLDKGAAGRFIRAGLAGNEKFDSERMQRKTEQMEQEFNAKARLSELDSKKEARREAKKKRKVEEDEGERSQAENKKEKRSKRNRKSKKES